MRDPYTWSFPIGQIAGIIIRVHILMPLILGGFILREAFRDPKELIPGAWIDASILRAYLRLHELGWAHSVEAWDAEGLAGGLYGVSIGGLFAAESMYHVRTDASKAAFVALVERLRAAGDADRRLLDAQWQTPHLERLGAVETPRAEYRRRLLEAVSLADAFA